MLSQAKRYATKALPKLVVEFPKRLACTALKSRYVKPSEETGSARKSAHLNFVLELDPDVEQPCDHVSDDLGGVGRPIPVTRPQDLGRWSAANRARRVRQKAL